MKTSIFYTRALTYGLAASTLLLLLADTQARAVSLTSSIKSYEQADTGSFAVSQLKNSHNLYSLSINFFRTQPIETGLTAREEVNTKVLHVLPPLEEKLTINIDPQPATGYNGEIQLTFNHSLAQGIEIIVQDMQGKVYYKAFHPTIENSLVLHFGDHLPILVRGNYLLTAVSDELVARKAFIVQ